jgi:hypothetical protein
MRTSAARMVLMRGQESFPDRTIATFTNGFVTAKE